MEMRKFIEEKVGSMVVKQIYPEENGWVLFILQIHPGITPYNSVLAPLLHRIRFLIALLHRILIHVQSISPFSFTKAALQSIVDQAKSLADSSGLSRQLDEAKLEYCGLVRVSLSKSVKAGNDVMFERIVMEKVDDGEELDEEEMEKRKIKEKNAYYARKGLNLHKYVISKSGFDYIFTNHLHYSSNDIFAVGKANSMDRRAFMERLLSEDTILSPARMKVGAPEWQQWILNAEEGRDLTQSARSTGGPPPSSFYPTDAAYTGSRKEAAVEGKLVERNVARSKQWGSGTKPAQISFDLADITKTRFSVLNGRGMIECLSCKQVEYGPTKKLTHRCSPDSSVDWKSLPLVLCSKEPQKYRTTYLLYPFQILDTEADIDDEIWSTLSILPILSNKKARLEFANTLAISHGLDWNLDEFIYTLAKEKSSDEKASDSWSFLELQAWSRLLCGLSASFRERTGVGKIEEESDLDAVCWAEKVIELLGKIDFSEGGSLNDGSRTKSPASLVHHRCRGHTQGNTCIQEPLRIGTSKDHELKHVPHDGYPSSSILSTDCAISTYDSLLSLPPSVVRMVNQAPSPSTGKTKKLWKVYNRIVKNGFTRYPEEWVPGLTLRRGKEE